MPLKFACHLFLYGVHPLKKEQEKKAKFKKLIQLLNSIWVIHEEEEEVIKQQNYLERLNQNVFMSKI